MKMSRRRFLGKGARLAVGVGATLGAAPLLGLATGDLRRALAQGAPLWEQPGMPPEITPVGQFYTISINLFDPRLDARDWSLTVEGLVERPLTLDYQQLTQYPNTVEAYVTLTCVSNEVGGPLTGNAIWRGVRLRDILQEAGVKPGAVDLVMEAYDNYTDSIPIEKALHPDTLLVYEMNGEPLRPQHGYPARLIVPGIYGMKNVKWIRRLRVVDYDFKGYWARRGWSDTAVIKTWSRIDIPRSAQVRVGERVVIGGLAYAGDRGISGVEVSVDGGRTWRPVDALKEPLGPYAWRLWAATWIPAESGTAELVVRAIDGRGEVQTAALAPPLPDGSSGWHRRRVSVRS
ncbi:MAG TPA: molybdopterin-dependent oxidoreductase [Limnochordales bacterium]